jgi:predicted aspartyl protease
MMQGIVNQSCEATLPIVIKNNATTQLVDTVIDTGFSGFLTLPFDIISALGLTWEGRDVATLGDGTSCTFEVYMAIVIWDGQYREIYVNESEIGHVLKLWNWKIMVRKSEVIVPNGSRTCSLSNLPKY